MKKLLLSSVLVPALLGSGCAVIPNGGYLSDLSPYGVPGEVLDTVTLGRGLLVEDVLLDEGRQVQVQVSRADRESYEDPTLHEQILTIGRYSKLLGSGFTGKDNIFYRKRIWRSGRDVFEVDGRHYLVEWTLNYEHPVTYLLDDMYTFEFRPLIPVEEERAQPSESP